MNAVCVEVDDELFPAATMTRLRVFRAYVTEAVVKDAPHVRYRIFS